MQVNIPRVQDKENEPPKPTRAAWLATTPPPAAAPTLGPLLSILEAEAEEPEMRTPSPILNPELEKLVHKGEISVTQLLHLRVKKAQRQSL